MILMWCAQNELSSHTVLRTILRTTVFIANSQNTLQCTYIYTLFLPFLPVLRLHKSQLGFAVCFIWNLTSGAWQALRHSLEWVSWRLGFLDVWNNVLSNSFPVCEAAKAVTKSYFCVLHVDEHSAGKNREKDNNLHGGEINFGATSVLRVQLCIQTTMGHQAGITHICQCLIHPGSFCISSSMYFCITAAVALATCQHIFMNKDLSWLCADKVNVNKQTNESCSKNQCHI